MSRETTRSTGKAVGSGSSGSSVGGSGGKYRAQQQGVSQHTAWSLVCPALLLAFVDPTLPHCTVISLVHMSI